MKLKTLKKFLNELNEGIEVKIWEQKDLTKDENGLSLIEVLEFYLMIKKGHYIDFEHKLFEEINKELIEDCRNTSSLKPLENALNYRDVSFETIESCFNSVLNEDDGLPF